MCVPEQCTRECFVNLRIYPTCQFRLRSAFIDVCWDMRILIRADRIASRQMAWHRCCSVEIAIVFAAEALLVNTKRSLVQLLSKEQSLP